VTDIGGPVKPEAVNASQPGSFNNPKGWAEYNEQVAELDLFHSEKGTALSPPVCRQSSHLLNSYEAIVRTTANPTIAYSKTRLGDLL
jgi:hypothetical protein